MLDLVRQIIDFYLTNLKEPTISDLKIEDESLLGKKINVFVTIFHKGNVRGSAGNIKEIEPNAVTELIKSTIDAIKNDSRFSPLTKKESKDIKIRVDEIKNRELLNENEIQKLDPLKHGVLVLKKDYSKLAVILPNISPLLLNGSDFNGVLTKKLGEKYIEQDYINYSIQTEILTDY